MSSPKNTQRRVHEEKNRMSRSLHKKSSSFHGQFPDMEMPQLRRPKTLPYMGSFRNEVGTTTSTELRPKLTKILLNVTIQGSVGAVQVLMPLDLTVKDLVAAALRQYKKKGRRPILPFVDPSLFNLHYSQFSLERPGLHREEKLMSLGSRNFFLCPSTNAMVGGGGVTMLSVSCSEQAEKVSRTWFSWIKFMDFLL